MMFGLEAPQFVFILLVGLAVGGVVLAVAMPLLAPSDAGARLKRATGARAAETRKAGVGRLLDGEKDNRRRKVQDTLKDIEDLLPYEKDGIVGAIAGRALYEGKIDFRTAARVAAGKG